MEQIGGRLCVEFCALAAVAKDEVTDRLQPLTRRYDDDFSRCLGCGQIYRPGSHHERLVRLVDGFRDQL